MQSTDLEEMKAAIFEQAYHPCTRVIRLLEDGGQKEQGATAGPASGLVRWYPAEVVTIEGPRLCPTGACDLEDGSDFQVKQRN